MDKLNILKLKELYTNIKNKNSEPNFYTYKKYFELSIFKNRDIFEFDSINFNLIKKIKLNKKNFKRSYIFLKKYIQSQKEYKYLLKKNNIFNYLFLIFKYIVFILDIFFVIIISLLKILLRKNRISNSNLEKKDIYSIFYWKTKRGNSIYYYYPHLRKEKNFLCIVTAFVDIKLFSLGLLLIKKRYNFITPIDIISLSDLFKSILIFLDIFFKDLSYLNKFSTSNFLKFLIAWSQSSKIFYNILIYLALARLSSKNNNYKFINWGENQSHLRAFALGVIKGSKNNISLSSFIGSPISTNYRKHLFPNKGEFDSGIWGRNIILQSDDCLEELQNYFQREKIKINLKLCSPEMVRSNFNFESSKDHKLKNYTIFVHDSYWDLESCFNCFYKFIKPTINKNIDDKFFINVRLHPSLNELISKNKLLEILSLYSCKQIVPLFIKEGNIKESIISSELCIFGESSYINYAISKNKNILCCVNNHRYNPPIYEKFQNYQKITFLEPW